jgi:hypothetical protein
MMWWWIEWCAAVAVPPSAKTNATAAMIVDRRFIGSLSVP